MMADSDLESREGEEFSIDDVKSKLHGQLEIQAVTGVPSPPLPAWLNEGMASFFEGTRFVPCHVGPGIMDVESKPVTGSVHVVGAEGFVCGHLETFD